MRSSDGATSLLSDCRRVPSPRGQRMPYGVVLLSIRLLNIEPINKTSKSEMDFVIDTTGQKDLLDKGRIAESDDDDTNIGIFGEYIFKC